MSDARPVVEPGCVFMDHMFDHTKDSDMIEISVDGGTDEATRIMIS